MITRATISLPNGTSQPVLHPIEELAVELVQGVDGETPHDDLLLALTDHPAWSERARPGLERLLQLLLDHGVLVAIAPAS